MKLNTLDLVIIIMVSILVGFGTLEPNWALSIPAYLFGKSIARRR